MNLMSKLGMALTSLYSSEESGKAEGSESSEEQGEEAVNIKAI